MAKDSPTTAPSEKETVRINWPKESKATIDPEAFELDAKARIIIEGTVKGFSMRDYGCSIELLPTSIKTEAIGNMADEVTKSQKVKKTWN